MGTKEHLNTLVQDFQHSNPQLYIALRALINRVTVIETDVETYINSVVTGTTSTSYTLVPPDNLSYTLPGTAILLTWNDVTRASKYEVREGTDWNTANFIVRTSSLSTAISPTTIGLHTYLIKSIDYSGAYSILSSSIAITIPEMGDIVISSQVIDNNILLSWSVPSHSFNLVEYEIYKDSTLVGKNTGTFSTIFEVVSGSYTYGVKALDIAGNYSNLYTTTAVVNQPPDYELVDTFNSDLIGTLVKCIKIDNAILGPIDIVETWAEHFTNNSWTTIQNQIDAGYTIYIQPSETTAYFEEIIDYGTTYSNSLVTANWAEQLVVSDVVISCQMCGSTNGSTYSAYVTGTTQFFLSVRYVKIKLTFTPTTLQSLIFISNIVVGLDIKYTTDSGNLTALSTDTNGTVVTFNKAFKDVNSINVTAKSVEPIYPVYNFTDIPNPTQFTVMIFDSSGKRITFPVSWFARGII